MLIFLAIFRKIRIVVKERKAASGQEWIYLPVGVSD